MVLRWRASRAGAPLQKDAFPCAGKLYQLMSKKNVLKAFLKSRSIVNMPVMYRQHPPPRAFPKHLTPLPSGGGGNLIIRVFQGWGI